ncbi:hypothetical protein PRNP1_012621 [Phytophthora ramorum]
MEAAQEEETLKTSTETQQAAGEQEEAPQTQQHQKPQRWKEALVRAVQAIADERRQSIGAGKLTSFADVVQAAAAFDRDGHIHMDFDEDDDVYDISQLQEQAKQREEESAKA